MERSTTLSTLAALLTAAMCCLTQPVQAQTAPAAIGGVLCDSEAQIRTIVAANQQSGDAMRTAYQHLNAMLNAGGQPSCAFQDMPHDLVSVPMSFDIGPWPAEGRTIQAFGLHIRAGNLDGWFLYLGPPSLLTGRNPSDAI